MVRLKICHIEISFSWPNSCHQPPSTTITISLHENHKNSSQCGSLKEEARTLDLTGTTLFTSPSVLFYLLLLHTLISSQQGCMEPGPWTTHSVRATVTCLRSDPHVCVWRTLFLNNRRSDLLHGIGATLKGISGGSCPVRWVLGILAAVFSLFPSWQKNFQISC